ncbi:MAG TPA: hypothetical protein PK019_08385 [Sedimentisphaerales bacterium]|jgi:DNA-binding XRE family transcriptional regulator|nr:hypothetical protein [Sedimentisphaerales bacterium]
MGLPRLWMGLTVAFRIARAFGTTVEDVFQYDGQADVPPTQ